MFLEIQSIEMLFSKLKKNRFAPRRSYSWVKLQPTVDFSWKTFMNLKIRMPPKLLTQPPSWYCPLLTPIGFYPRARDHGPKCPGFRSSRMDIRAEKRLLSVCTFSGGQHLVSAHSIPKHHFLTSKRCRSQFLVQHWTFQVSMIFWNHEIRKNH